jgi:hypothetical protein
MTKVLVAMRLVLLLGGCARVIPGYHGYVDVYGNTQSPGDGPTAAD